MAERRMESLDLPQARLAHVLLILAAWGLCGAMVVASGTRVGFYDQQGNYPRPALFLTYASAGMILLAAAHGWIARQQSGRRVDSPFIVPVILILASAGLNHATGFSRISLVPLGYLLIGAALIAVAPTTRLSDAPRRVRTALVLPFLALSSASLVFYAATGGAGYFFPWYNQWALFGVILVATWISGIDIHPRLRMLCIVIGTLSVVLSTSRQGYAALILCLVVLVVQSPALHRRVQYAAVTLFIGLAGWISVTTNERIVSADKDFTTAEGRLSYARIAWENFLSSPLTGYSDPSATFYEALNRAYLGYTVSSHNFVLDQLMAGGFLAGCGAVLFIVVWARWRDGKGRRPQLVFVAAALPFFFLGAQLLFTHNIVSAVCLAFFVIIGMSGEPARAEGLDTAGQEVLQRTRAPRTARS